MGGGVQWRGGCTLGRTREAKWLGQSYVKQLWKSRLTGLVAVEELDLKESTVDRGLHPASSRCLSPAWSQRVQTHPHTQHWKH